MGHMMVERRDAYEFAYRKVLYPLYESGLRGRGTLRYLEEYESNQWKSRDELAAIQWQKVQRLLRFCGEEVPYYRERWKAAGIDWRDVRSMEDFGRLPILTKDDIRTNYQSLIADSQRGRTMKKATGGSTGQPLAFEYTRESYERRTAVMLRGYAWAGGRVGRRTAFVWGADVGKGRLANTIKVGLHHWLLRRRVLNSFLLTRENISEYQVAIDRFKPHILVGYVSPLHILARHRLESGSRGWQPEAIITGAEKLHEFQRDDLKRAFGAPVFNTYGCREFMLMASECAEHRGLHVNMDHLVLELVDGEGKASDAGRVLVTDLHNCGMPFIRYQNGDIASWSSGRCPCGRELPMLQAVEGRMLDVIRTCDGRTVPGEFFPHLMKDVRGVIQFQVTQRRLDELTVAIVKDQGFDESSMQYLSNAVRQVLGERIAVKYEFPERIPLTSSGKQRVTISMLDGH